jgi:hypothetical protein
LFAAVSSFWAFGLLAVGVIKLVIDGERLFFVRDSILKQLYEQDRGFWIQLGKPTGRIWRPRGEAANVLGGAFHRPLWKAGSRIEQCPRVEQKFQAQIAIGRQLTLVDVPLLVVGIALALVFSIK